VLETNELDPGFDEDCEMLDIVDVFELNELKDDDFDDNVELIMLLLVLESCVLLDISDDDGDDKLLDMKPLLLLNSGGLLVLELRDVVIELDLLRLEDGTDVKEDVSALEELNDSSQRHSSIGKMLSDD
jgi:hypothetical protein